MKGYSPTAIGVLAMAQVQGGKIVYPDDIKRLAQFKTSPRDTREGYLNKLVKVDLLKAPEDKSVLSRYTLSEKGDWVVRMYAGGWAYADEQWSAGGMTLDAVTVEEIEGMGIVPSYVQNVEDLQES